MICASGAQAHQTQGSVMSPNSQAVLCCLATAVVLFASSCTPANSPPDDGPASSVAGAATVGPTVSNEEEPDPAANTPTTGDLLPDLAMLPLDSFHLAYEGDRKVLRFDASIVNKGIGPLDVTGVRPSVLARELQVTQNILQADGSVREVETGAIMQYEVEDGHDHFHVQEFQRYQLRPADGTEWRGSRKEGWCLRDDGNLGGEQRRYDDDSFDCGAEEEAEALEVRQGLTEGWVDVYDWYLEGQYVELDGFTLPGDFCVAADADPEQLLTEASRENNGTSTLVHITETDVSVIRQGC